jgi:hypothetical protein
MTARLPLPSFCPSYNIIFCRVSLSLATNANLFFIFSSYEWIAFAELAIFKSF